MLFDEVLKNVLGEFGTFTKRIIGLVCFEEVFFSFQVMSAVFLTSQPTFWCNPPGSSSLNCTREEMTNITVPWDSEEAGFDHCKMFDRNYSSIGMDDISACTQPPPDYPRPKECSEWIFDDSEMGITITAEWSTVCSNAWMASTIAAVFLGGRAAGNFIFGWLADIFGRKKVIFCAGLGSLAAGAACAAAPNYTFFVVFRFLQATLATGKTNCGFVMALEVSGPSWRVFSAGLYMISWAVGYMILAGIAYAERFLTWRYLLMTLIIPEVLYYPLVYFFMPESPRWLYLRERRKEADDIVKHIAKVNGKQLPPDLKIVEKDDVSSRSPLDLLRTPGIRIITCIMFYNWLANGFVYYGLSMNTGNLGGNRYINYAISGAVEIPAYILLIWSFKRMGRIIPYMLCMVVGGAAMLLIPAIPSTADWAVVTLAMIGKFFISASFAMAWVYSGEVYPTCIRNLGITVTGIAARISSPVSPYIALLGDTNQALPYIIFGILSLTAGLLVLFLPETRGKPMPQTIEDGEDLFRNNRMKLAFWRKNKTSNMQNDDKVSVQKTEDPIAITRF